MSSKAWEHEIVHVEVGYCSFSLEKELFRGWTPFSVGIYYSTVRHLLIWGVSTPVSPQNSVLMAFGAPGDEPSTNLEYSHIILVCSRDIWKSW